MEKSKLDTRLQLANGLAGLRALFADCYYASDLVSKEVIVLSGELSSEAKETIAYHNSHIRRLMSTYEIKI